MEEKLERYREWLATLNYSGSTIKSNPSHIKEFIEKTKVNSAKEICSGTIQEYFTYLSHRKHKNRAGGLSINYLKKHQSSLRQFSRYLRETGQESFEVNISIKGKQENRPVVLSKEEIERLHTQKTSNETFTPQQ